LVFIAKRWAKGFGIEDKNVEERIYIYVKVCAYIKRKKRKRERGERKERKGRKEKKKREKIQGNARRI
jgi:hypothetical protein